MAHETPIEIAVVPGERLLDLIDEMPTGGRVPFSCRDANCGVCAVVVVAGEELLEPASAQEISLLAASGRPEAARLACQLRARSSGTVRLGTCTAGR